MKELDKIADECKTWARKATPTHLIKLTFFLEYLKINHREVVDTMFFKNRPVIHLIDESTHLSAVSFLKKQSTDEIWKKKSSRLWFSGYMTSQTISKLT